MKCPECEEDMEEAYFMTGESYWSPEKGILKGMSKRERIRFPRQADAWRCKRCHLIIARY